MEVGKSDSPDGVVDPMTSKSCEYCGGDLKDQSDGFHQCEDCGRQVANNFLSDQ